MFRESFLGLISFLLVSETERGRIGCIRLNPTCVEDPGVGKRTGVEVPRTNHSGNVPGMWNHDEPGWRSRNDRYRMVVVHLLLHRLNRRKRGLSGRSASSALHEKRRVLTMVAETIIWSVGE